MSCCLSRKIFDEQFHLVDVHEIPLLHLPYSPGKQRDKCGWGRLTSDGLTSKSEAPEGAEFCLEVLGQDDRRTVE